MVHQSDLVIIGVSVGLALGILIASLVFFGIRWYKNRANLRRCANERSLTTLPIRTNGLGTSTDFSASLAHSINIQGSEKPEKSSPFFWWNHHSKDQFASASGILRYSYKDIQKATQNFTTILGQGSFGPVYKAGLPGGVVAVKVLATNSKQGEKEFQTEVSLLGRLHHRNLVNLLGYCVDKGQRMLIYEFMSNGSLANLLYNEEEIVLGWEERLQIALDISHGIEYLHEGAAPPVIHRDLKSANILLDQSMRAKVADFGLSKEESYDGRNSGLKGTYGYIDPVYISTNEFTMKSDIYSFGIIIFELITAIHPQQNLMEYINLAAMSSDGVDEILDQKLVGECNMEEVRELAAIAHKCLQKSQRKRPSIGEVSQAILKIKQRHLAKEDTMSFASQAFSRAVSRIEEQQVELSSMASIKEYN
ncbi:calcium/calmodulin-regulated receptor-like kinase 2 [Ricinus communis]|uniref:Serine/threonine-protein kinase PBS1, putative n=1 Tax=Ricinus communis TaxID=3988 RepID=B9SIY3_RICCO|nr:calcium/calmodulin-regulated receptor-like kinase 2 [Ricinus communis]XP_015578916.1 calcium/calmodulin-regulated receptor-like kinase 2 [Ricinus communis]XP_048229937.1 calcium/calmodulin-regulated receptor-like kinase 2 [Ricinus communis]XP_048229938.1 calcium/calmodulin-regulated receptor-like kinase 2 [Ricinus communis]EEF36472.1 Serine/threonine-protein kinase PBS1, putative [Ricinus communis]|eukprot:XP_002525952.1 calcium/calmodulin-regulated receptor-like kinase 2 [Ricinus communis]